MTAVEWFAETIHKMGYVSSNILQQAKQMEKEQHGNTWDEAIDEESIYITFEQYYNETYGSKGSDECQFEPSTNTSSATICANCGKEKFLH
jgi:hypothetical protein